MKNNIRSQAGVSFFGWLVIIALIAFFATSILTLYPMYYNHYKATAHLKSVANDFATVTMNKKEIKTAISKRFQVDNISFINQAKDIKIEIKKKNKKKQTIINLSYEVRAHLMGNIFVVGDFSDNVFEVRSP
ncbi:hypothetical protein MNBD_GAMMA16-1416 [hydrothermal vent metagenome]|uniref:DUF4845 domain-containing protein n=1 Tax=hydrothermal vent metagenome TaxID=652676 RepID=A0A3B0ZM04_9ZZZZ